MGLAPVRYTPAGIPVREFRLMHESTVSEAGRARHAEAELDTVVIGNLANEIADLAEGAHVCVEGFLARRSVNSPRVILHAECITNCQ